MRKKALLAGAISSFEGPWVTLEPGEWLVEPSRDVSISSLSLEEREEIEGSEDSLELKIRGPARIRAIVSPEYKGPGIFLSAYQISNSTNGVEP